MTELFFIGLLAEADTSDWGWTFLVSLLAGIAGATWGAYAWIKNTTTGAERRFLINSLVVSCLGVILLMLVPAALSQFGLIPVWFRWLLFALCVVLAVPLTVWSNRRRAQLRGSQGPGAPPQA
jgi:hypothetical protein